MPKHTGNLFRNLLSSRLDLWKVKASKVVGMAWEKLRWRFKFRATTCLSKRKNHYGSLPTAPKEKLSCLGNNTWGLWFPRGRDKGPEHPAVSVVCYGDTSSMGNVPHALIARVFSGLARIIFLMALMKSKPTWQRQTFTTEPSQERELSESF